jgi:hypothetical protein
VLDQVGTAVTTRDDMRLLGGGYGVLGTLDPTVKWAEKFAAKWKQQ